MTIPSEQRASVTFLSPSAGGRSRPALNSPLYRPHVVVGNPNQRKALLGPNGDATESYLGIQFTGNGAELTFGVAHEVTLVLTFAPDVDYSQFAQRATFTIREGAHIVGFGHVLGSRAIR